MKRLAGEHCQGVGRGGSRYGRIDFPRQRDQGKLPSDLVERLEETDGVAKVGRPALELGMLGVSVTAMVPGHHSPSARCKTWREAVESTAEVMSAVGQEQGWIGLLAPLVNCQQCAVAIDVARSEEHTSELQSP